MGLSVLVTGGSGFLGAQVVPRLVGRGAEVSVICRSDEAGAKACAHGATPLRADLDDRASVDRAFDGRGFTVVVNLASLGFGHAPTLVRSAQEAGVERALFVSTTGIYTTLSSASKRVRLAAEEVIEASDLRWTIVRPTMIYGRPGDRNIERLLGFLRRARVVPLPGGGHGLHQPVHVDDLADAIVAAISAPEAEQRAYNLAGPTALPLRELVRIASEALDRRPRLVPVPLRPIIPIFRAYERVATQPRLKAEQLERLAEDKAFDIASAARDLGFTPRPFTEGIRLEIDLLAASPGALDGR